MRLLSEAAARLAVTSGIAALLARAPRLLAVALCYHRIGTPHGRGTADLWSATPAELAEQLDFLARHFELIPAGALPEALESGSGRYAVISFDDGYRDNYELALPLLAERGTPATFFVTSGFIDGTRRAWWDEIAGLVKRSEHPRLPASEWFPAGLELREQGGERAAWAAAELYKRLPAERAAALLGYLRAELGPADAGAAPGAASAEPGPGDADPPAGPWMSWEMVREARRAGIEIGGHTVSHPVLARLDRAGQWAEIAGCAERLEAELGEPMRVFSYPVGRPDSFDRASREHLRRLGVLAAFSCHGGRPRPGRFEALALPRVPVSATDSRARLRARACVPALFARA